MTTMWRSSWGKGLTVGVVCVAVAVGLARWRTEVVLEDGREFAAARLESTMTSASHYTEAWHEAFSRQAEHVGTAVLTLSASPASGSSFPGEDFLSVWLGEVLDDEVTAIHVTDPRRLSLAVGRPELGSERVAVLDELARRTRMPVPGAAHMVEAPHALLVPVVVPVCEESVGREDDCVVVIFEVDLRARLLPALHGLRGAGQSSRSILLAPNGRAIMIFHQDTEAPWRPFDSTAELDDATIADAFLPGTPSYARTRSDGATLTGVTRTLEGPGLGLVREMYEEEAMWNHHRQVSLERFLAVTAFLILGLGWVGYDRTVGAARARRLAESEARLATVVRSTSDAILVVSGEGVIEIANEAAGRLLLQSPDELTGSRLDERLGAEAIEALGDLVASRPYGTKLAPTSGRPRELSVSRPDGSSIACEVSASATSEGPGSAVALILRDVTERKAFEEKLRETERLAAVARLIGGVAHEINNPLAVITMTTELLSLDLDSSEAQTDLDAIRLAAGRAGRIVRDLLRFIDHYPVVPGDVELEALLTDVEGKVRETLDALDVELERPPTPGNPVVHVDRVAMAQAIENLVVNGAQASGRGGRVRLESERSNGKILIRVTDSGPGVPDDIRSRIFEPFFTTRAIGDGPGLGLSVALGVVTQHEGDLLLERSSPEGASFVIVLPATAAA